MTEHSQRTKTIKVTEESFEQLKILKLATNESYVTLVERAIAHLVEVTALENQKVRTIETLFHDFKPPDEVQMSIEEFL